MSNIYKINKVCKIYPNNNIALKNISLEIKQGEILCLIGANGSGKTTLSSIIASLIPMTSGEVLYNEKSIHENISEYRKLVGLCPQKINLDNRITVRENLINDALFFGFSYEYAVMKFAEISKQLELGKYEDYNPIALSGGYKQRVSIGRSLMHNPSLVIFDEPTLGLDPHIRKNLWDTIMKLKSNGISILLTTHYMDEVEFLADRICWLHSGSIKFLGSLEELKENYKGNLEEIIIQCSEEG